MKQKLLCSLLIALVLSNLAHGDGPKVTKKVPPEFPADAGLKGITEGLLKVSLTVDAQGAVTSVTIVEASPAKAKIFANAAIDALKQWRFEALGKVTTVEMKLVFQQD